MSRVASLALASLLAFTTAACTDGQPRGSSLSPTHVPGSPTLMSPSPAPAQDSHLPLVERLRAQPGVFEGVRYPRLQHWAPRDANAYTAGFDLCDRVGLRDLSTQLHVREAPAVVATAILGGFDQEVWRAAHQGCADGLVWDAKGP